MVVVVMVVVIGMMMGMTVINTPTSSAIAITIAGRSTLMRSR
jgi:hypothetical protein